MAVDERRSQYLTFVVAGEEYAMPLLAVREIVQYDQSLRATRVPQTPAWIHGIVNLRGSVVAVVDLAVKFGLPPARVGRSTCIVVTELSLHDERVTLGVLTDAVHEVLELADAEIQPPPEFGVRVHAEFLRGVGRTQHGLVLVLDHEAALSKEQLPAAELAAADLEATTPSASVLV